MLLFFESLLCSVFPDLTVWDCFASVVNSQTLTQLRSASLNEENIIYCSWTSTMSCTWTHHVFSVLLYLWMTQCHEKLRSNLLSLNWRGTKYWDVHSGLKTRHSESVFLTFEAIPTLFLSSQDHIYDSVGLYRCRMGFKMLRWDATELRNWINKHQTVESEWFSGTKSISLI